MGLSEHEKAVRAAVAKTEREGKLRAARFRVEQLQTKYEKARADAGKIKSELDAAHLALTAVEDQIKMADRAEKVPPASPVKPADPAKQTAAVPPADVTPDPLQETAP